MTSLWPSDFYVYVLSLSFWLPLFSPESKIREGVCTTSAPASLCNHQTSLLVLPLVSLPLVRGIVMKWSHFVCSSRKWLCTWWWTPRSSPNGSCNYFSRLWIWRTQPAVYRSAALAHGQQMFGNIRCSAIGKAQVLNSSRVAGWLVYNSLYHRKAWFWYVTVWQKLLQHPDCSGCGCGTF